MIEYQENGDYAPIALFVYNRPDHLIKVIEALKNNHLSIKSDIFIYSDGPKDKNAESNVNLVRQYLDSITGFRSIKIIKSLFNKGLSASIISGVSEVCSRYGKVIVLEDDLITSPHFLNFMNRALSFYKNDERVISIHGYVYPVKEPLPETFFLRGADCWGWATWKRGWDLFDNRGEYLLKKIKKEKLEYSFNFDGSYNYLDLLKMQIRGKSDSWAIRWHASAFLQNKFTLYPGISLVANIGFDGSGANCQPTKGYDVKISYNLPNLEFVSNVDESLLAKKLIKEFLLSSQPTLFSKILFKFIAISNKIQNKK